MGDVRIVLNHGDIESIEDSFSDECLQYANQAKAAADAMRSDKWVAPFQAGLKPGSKGGRRFAYVGAFAPSTRRDNARNNILLKAKPW